MTRKNIKSKAISLIQESTYQTELNLLGFIDEIYDDFESQTCENCKHIDLTTNNYCYMFKSGINIDWIAEDFGCNKFESKDNK